MNLFKWFEIFHLFKKNRCLGRDFSVDKYYLELKRFWFVSVVKTKDGTEINKSFQVLKKKHFF